MQVLVEFEDAVADETGRTFRARVCGREDGSNIWEGWIEFEPVAGGVVLRTPRETTQPNLPDLEYWATGLTEAYLEGALERALQPAPHVRPQRTTASKPAYDGPAPTTARPGEEPTRGGHAHAVLDPFQVHAQGEGLLRDELNALDEDHLRTIIREYSLAPDGADPLAYGRQELTGMIVEAVRRRRV
jgi:hypothetical protein